MSAGPSPARARSTAHAKAAATASGSVPSMVTAGTPYPIALSANTRTAEVADHRADHIAGPTSVTAAPGRTPPQPDRRRVDRLLPERPEAFALKRRRSVPDLAAREERFQPIVGRAGQEHAAENLAALVGRQRGFEGSPPEEAVAGVQQLREPLVDARFRRRARRRLGQARRQRTR